MVYLHWTFSKDLDQSVNWDGVTVMGSCVTFRFKYTPQICKTSFYNMASLCFLLLLLTVKTAFAAKVLGYSAFGTGSHYYVVSSTLQELARTLGTKTLELFKPRLSIRSPVSVKSRLRTGDCRTGLKCELQTTDSLSIYPVLPIIEC